MARAISLSLQVSAPSHAAVAIASPQRPNFQQPAAAPIHQQQQLQQRTESQRAEQWEQDQLALAISLSLSEVRAEVDIASPDGISRSEVMPSQGPLDFSPSAPSPTAPLESQGAQVAQVDSELHSPPAMESAFLNHDGLVTSQPPPVYTVSAAEVSNSLSMP